MNAKKVAVAIGKLLGETARWTCSCALVMTAIATLALVLFGGTPFISCLTMSPEPPAFNPELSWIARWAGWWLVMVLSLWIDYLVSHIELFLLEGLAIGICVHLRAPRAAMVAAALPLLYEGVNSGHLVYFNLFEYLPAYPQYLRVAMGNVVGFLAPAIVSGPLLVHWARRRIAKRATSEPKSAVNGPESS